MQCTASPKGALHIAPQPLLQATCCPVQSHPNEGHHLKCRTAAPHTIMFSNLLHACAQPVSSLCPAVGSHMRHSSMTCPWRLCANVRSRLWQQVMQDLVHTASKQRKAKLCRGDNYAQQGGMMSLIKWVSRCFLSCVRSGEGGGYLCFLSMV